VKTLEECFDEKWTPEPNTGCWLWLGALDTPGYGQVRQRGKMLMAHRVAYERWVGEVPAGLHVDHLCRQRCCVNPEHLEPVTNAENLRRGISHNRARTHCRAGHEFDEKNTYATPDGRRECRSCHRDRDRRRRARRRELRLDGEG